MLENSYNYIQPFANFVIISKLILREVKLIWIVHDYYYYFFYYSDKIYLSLYFVAQSNPPNHILKDIYIYIYRKKLKSLWKNKNNQKWNNNFTFLFFSFLLIIPLRVSCKRVSFQVKSRLFVASPFPPHPFSFSLFYLQKQSQWSGAQCNFTMQRTMRRINGSYKMDESTRRTAGEDSKQQWSFREWNYWSWGGKKKNKFHEWRSTGCEGVIWCCNK